MNRVGDGTRILNFLIDTFIVFWMAFLCFRWYNFYVMYWHFKTINFWWFFAGCIEVYYIFFESIFTRTPGKWLSASKVINQQGKPPGIAQILIRSLIRLIPIDFMFNAFFGKPLHDYLSKTEVTEA